jgi:hypothetical protein
MLASFYIPKTKDESPVAATNFSRSNFKSFLSESNNQKKLEHLWCKYSDRIPCFIERSPNANILTPYSEPIKMLPAKDMQISSLFRIIRKKINLRPYEGIYLFINNSIIPSNTQTVEQLFNLHGHGHRVLYITYSVESTFG